jgi:nicotinate phosphoribosyltransferase
VNGLLTDLYELTMAAGYFAAGKSADVGTFEFSIRRLPRHRDFVVVAGLHRAVEYLLGLSFEPEEIDYLRGLPQFRHAPSEFWTYLADFRFTGDVFAVPEGTVLYAGEPVLNVRAPLIEGQIPETYLLSAITFETLIATKAALIVNAAQGRDIVEFGTRRAHSPEAGVLAARAAWIGGCAGTSNALAGFRYGVPVMGTAAHSWVLSFETEAEAFAELQKLFDTQTVQLIDTYDPIEGAREVARLGRPLWGVRIDNGDLYRLSRDVRRILDAAGLNDSKIMASGDLDEARIAALLAQGAPIDAFGVGTELSTSGDAPSMGTIYKLVDLATPRGLRWTAKESGEKSTVPGAKQIFRFPDHDVVALNDECFASAKALLRPVILGGRLIEPLPDLEQTRERAAAELTPWPGPDHRVEFSPKLKQLQEETRARVLRY